MAWTGMTVWLLDLCNIYNSWMVSYWFASYFTKVFWMLVSINECLCDGIYVYIYIYRYIYIYTAFNGLIHMVYCLLYTYIISSPVITMSTFCDTILHCMGVILTHWGRVTHIFVGNLTIIGSDKGLSPGRRQAIIWTNVGILLIGLLGTNFSEIQIEIRAFSFKNMRLKVSSAKWRPSCLGLNVLNCLHLAHYLYLIIGQLHVVV